MDNQLDSCVYATLSIYSTGLSERELRKLIPIEPSATIQKGTPRSGKQPRNVHKRSMLSFKSCLECSAPPEAHLADLLDLVRPAKQQIRADEARIADPDTRMHVYVRFVVGAKSWMSGFDLDASSLQDILDLGAGFGIEVDVEEGDDDHDADW